MIDQVQTKIIEWRKNIHTKLLASEPVIGDAEWSVEFVMHSRIDGGAIYKCSTDWMPPGAVRIPQISGGDKLEFYLFKFPPPADNNSKQ
jgi:hypothetical protein